MVIERFWNWFEKPGLAQALTCLGLIAIPAVGFGLMAGLLG